MKKWFQDNIMSSLSLGVLIAGAVWFGKAEGLWFTSVEKRVTTEKMVEDIDPIKMYGEYIIDSIEEVETQKFRMQQKKLDTFYTQKLRGIDSLLRLNVRISSEAKKEIQEIH